MFDGTRDLLRVAAAAVAETGAGDAGTGPSPAADYETEALTRFALENGLMLDAEEVRQLMDEHALKGGCEHRVAFVENRVLKDLDAHALATESLFDYLTDHQLANHYFGDDIALEGFYQHQGRLHVVISQSFVRGAHPGWDGLIAGLAEGGLRHASPTSKIPNFIFHEPLIGSDIEVTDLHEDNVVIGSETGEAYPIDAHFYFADRAARRQALRVLGLDKPAQGDTSWAVGGAG